MTRSKNNVFEHQKMTLKKRQQRMELVHHMKEQLAMGEQNLIIVNGKIVVKKRPGGIQLKCLHMWAMQTT